MSGVDPQEPDTSVVPFRQAEVPALPTSDVVRALGAIDPETRKDIMGYAMQVSDYKKSVVEHRYRTVRNGQLAALGLSVIFLACSVYLIVTGFGVYGTVLGGIDLVALASAFLAVANGQKKGI